MSVFLSVLAVAIGMMLIGVALGTIVNNQIQLIWAFPLTLFVAFPAFVFGAWLVYPFR